MNFIFEWSNTFYKQVQCVYLPLFQAGEDCCPVLWHEELPQLRGQACTGEDHRKITKEQINLLSYGLLWPWGEKTSHNFEIITKWTKLYSAPGYLHLFGLGKQENLKKRLIHTVTLFEVSTSFELTCSFRCYLENSQMLFNFLCMVTLYNIRWCISFIQALRTVHTPQSWHFFVFFSCK